MSIYVEFDKPSTIKEFLRKFFSGGDQWVRTGVATYYDEDCYSEHCDTDRYRSFDDIYDCVKTYFPSVTRKRVMHELLLLEFQSGYKKTDVQRLKMSTCSDIERVVTYYYMSNNIYYPYDAEQYDSDYSWQDLLKLLGITNQKTLDDYVEKAKAKELAKELLKAKNRRKGRIKRARATA